MKIFKSVLLMSSIILSNGVVAGTFYDDWDVEVVPGEVKETTLYWGPNHCVAEFRTYEGGPLERHDYPADFLKYQAVSEARPDRWVQTVYVDLYGNKTKPYRKCDLVGPYPYKFVETEVLSYKNKYTPIQPYPSFVKYEFGGCRFGVRQGAIDIGTSGISASNMKVFVTSGSTGYANNKIYDGNHKSFVGYNVGTNSSVSRNVRVKFDDGSSSYLSINIPGCSSGDGEVDPR
jgi:hypothetical protein